MGAECRQRLKHPPKAIIQERNVVRFNAYLHLAYEFTSMSESWLQMV